MPKTSEIRPPKSEGKPKSEIRMPHSIPSNSTQNQTSEKLPENVPAHRSSIPTFLRRELRPSVFGLRISFGFRKSDFGFLSALGFRAFGIPQQSTPRAAQFMMTIE
jgi:hypothetical protein